jgi:drug/metabolite transporter (DMT)-like permease
VNPVASDARLEAAADVRVAPAAAGRRRHRSSLMLFLMLIATFCWATNIIAGKEALRSFGALVLAQMRVLGTSTVYILLFFAWPRQRSLRRSRDDWAVLGLAALFGVTLNQLFFIGGLARTSAAHTALIVALGPVMVLVLSRILRMEALTLLKSVGILLAFCGVAVLTTGKGGGGNGAHWQGDLLAFAGSAVFAYFTILMKKAAVQSDALTLNTIVFTLGSILMLPFTASELIAVHWSAVPSLAWWSLAYMVIVGSVLAYMLFAFALAELTPSRVAAFNYLQPLIAISLGVWMLGEKVTSGLIAGGALILAGLYLTERENSEV